MKKLFIVLIVCLVIIPFCIYAQNYQISPINKKILKDGKMHIYFCGTGSPQVEMQGIRKPACLAVITDGHFFLFDAAEGSIETIAGMGLPYLSIDKVFMTHLHSDHFAGLGQVINVTWERGRNTLLDIYGPFGVDKVVNGLNEAYYLDVLYRAANANGSLDPSMEFGAPHVINYEQLNKPVFQKDKLSVTPFLVDHRPVFPAYGYTLQYKGCKIVISGDTAVVDSLAKQAKGADILINEVFSHPMQEHNNENMLRAITDPKLKQETRESLKNIASYHSDSWDLAKMAQNAGVKNLILTHLVPTIPTDADSKKLLTQGMDQYYKKVITVVNDRDEIVVESDNSGVCRMQYIPAEQPEIKAIDITDPDESYPVKG